VAAGEFPFADEMAQTQPADETDRIRGRVDYKHSGLMGYHFGLSGKRFRCSQGLCAG